MDFRIGMWGIVFQVIFIAKSIGMGRIRTTAPDGEIRVVWGRKWSKIIINNYNIL